MCIQIKWRSCSNAHYNEVWGEAWDSDFLVSSQVLLLLLAHELDMDIDMFTENQDVK